MGLNPVHPHVNKTVHSALQLPWTLSVSPALLGYNYIEILQSQLERNAPGRSSPGWSPTGLLWCFLLPSVGIFPLPSRSGQALSRWRSLTFGKSGLALSDAVPVSLISMAFSPVRI